jgi:hypothetical protein
VANAIRDIADGGHMPGTLPNADSTHAPPDSLPESDEPRDGSTQRFARYDTDLSSVLAFAPREVPLEIRQIADQHARDYCAVLGVDPGDHITRHDGLKDEVALSTADGRRVRLALPVALFVEVEPALPS